MAFSSITSQTAQKADQVTCVNQGAYDATTAAISDEYACFHFRESIPNNTDGQLTFYVYSITQLSDYTAENADPFATDSQNPTSTLLCSKNALR